MEYLDLVFNLVLDMLKSFIADERLGAGLWIFIIVMTLLIFINLVRSLWHA